MSNYFNLESMVDDAFKYKEIKLLIIYDKERIKITGIKPGDIKGQIFSFLLIFARKQTRNR
jgi:hypothetical protein